ncbi:23S rRNA (pseudouridine(1915)-N(3))-methyltransferase RlmH [Microvirga brassicacearum]|uniref:Ribosomal RNA large subunit methyltransferase H n=1 Tax=Microvirga brassicacearum TaxID=2580413 RepID=A0A5N3PHE6_9HYPH|nr:23S rRNA (pseudouridine(1915)-N(3))-methyltransferase RlmH [Microvirga brassicacearum]KAB0269157.1 23S rRNA (pseudouridine(1915)-N(3))-methyltransferase RlmH [Microvirga brassicacearum]
MRLSLLAVGRLKSGPERELVERYRQRIEGLGRSLGVAGLDLVEFPESRARRDDDRRGEEAVAILERTGSSALIAFDERGKSPSSDVFADRIRHWRDEGVAGIACVIGGPDGLDPQVLQRAKLVVSFGALTMPHQIVRALVAEQLYRALTIIAGHPYHRAGHDDS